MSVDVDVCHDASINKIEFKFKDVPRFELVAQGRQLIPKVRRREIEYFPCGNADRLEFGGVQGSNSGDEP